MIAIPIQVVMLVFLIGLICSSESHAKQNSYRVLLTPKNGLPPSPHAVRQGNEHEFGVTLNFGLVADQNVWLWFDLSNMQNNQVLKLSDMTIEHLQLYSATEAGGIEKISEPQNHLSAILGIQIPSTVAGNEVFVRIAPDSFLALKPMFGYADAFLGDHVRQLAIKVALVALVFLVSLISFCAYYLFKEKFLLYFGGYGIGMTVLLVSYSGLASALFKEQWSHYFSNVVFILSHTVTAAVYYLFAREFMGIASRSRKVNQAFQAGILFSIVASIAGIVAPLQSIVLVPISGVVSGILIGLALLVSFQKATTPIKIYLASLAVFLFFIIIYTLDVAGVLGDHPLFGFELLIGAAIDMIMMMAAVGLKVKIIADERLAEQERARQIVERNTRLASMGLLAGGMAHEISTPLATLKAFLSNLRFLLERTPNDHQRILALSHDAEKTLEGLTDITKSLRALAGKNTPLEEFKIIKLRELSSLIQNAANDHPQFAKVQCQFEDWPTDVLIRGDIPQFTRVFRNLINNAIDAVSENNSTTSIGSGVDQPPALGWVKVRAEILADSVQFFVTNSGPKIPDAVAATIFDPFFTTKAFGKGMGLGLSICRTIVLNLGGKIEIDPTCAFTQFKMTFPRAKDGPGNRSL